MRTITGICGWMLLVVSCGSPPAVTATHAPKPIAPAAPASMSERIDTLLAERWKKQDIAPAAVCDDATFLRRASLDIVGRIPEPEEVRKFLADTTSDKRVRLVGELLKSPAYAAHWMNYWDDVLMGRDARSNLVDRVAFRAWLRARFSENASWDKIVTGLVAATGQNSSGGAKRGALAMPMAELLEGEELNAEEPGINGAVNYALRFNDAPQDLAGSESKTFLGIQIQCAQCHDHKTEKWKQDDFRSFASAALHAAVVVDKDKMVGGVRVATVKDAPRVLPRVNGMADAAPIAKAKPRALDGTSLEKKEETRRALAAWMTTPENPYFARAFVNRMWGHFLGRGFSDPVDDMRATNPPEAEDILEAMARDFSARGFDVKYLIAQIASTRAYHLAADASAKTDPDNRLWAKFRLVPLGPEELSNALFAATGIEEAARAAGVTKLAELRSQVIKQFSFLFDVDEEFDARDYAGSVTQALTMMNGNLVGFGAKALPSSTLAQTLASVPNDDARVDAVFIRVLGRPTREEEKKRWLAYVTEAVTPAPSTLGQSARAPRGKGGRDGFGRLNAPPNKKKPVAGAVIDAKTAAYEDLMWALLNSSEFMFNH